MTARSNRRDEPGRAPPTHSLERLLVRLEAMTEQLDELQCQLEHADRLASLGTLAATIAHEFNNILTPGMSWAQLALRSFETGKPDLELAHKALVKCHAAGQKAGRICESILNLSRVPADLHAPGECDLAAVVDEALTAMARDPSKDGIMLRKHIPEGLQVAMDPLQLEHVLINLLINAQQAMHAKRRGMITLTAARDRGAAGDFVRLEITDTGCGIGPEDLPRIFDSFYTNRAGPSSRGTGLGLSLCRTILERNRGQISAQSTPGRGTTFKLILPCPPAARANLAA